MNSKTEKVIVEDCNTVANGIMKDINDIDAIERSFSIELSSEDLFRIDSAILASLRNTKDFSRDLLQQLESGKFEMVSARPAKSFETEVSKIQQDTILDITLPLQNMFDEMSNYVEEAFIRS